MSPFSQSFIVQWDNDTQSQKERKVRLNDFFRVSRLRRTD